MDITRLTDAFGDDIYALALITTKDFDSAREIYVRTTTKCDEYPDSAELVNFVADEFPLCKDAECNDSAVTLTGVELDLKKQALLETVLQKPFVVRSIIHMFWENDLEIEDIAEITGESAKYVRSVIEGLSDSLRTALDKSYKDICVRICAPDKLKAYVIRSVNSGNKRQFEVKQDAVPTHRWTKDQKMAVYIAAALIAVILCIVIPLAESYYNMRKEEGFKDWRKTEEASVQTVEAADQSDWLF